MTTTEQRQSTGSGVARATFGTVLFIAWGVLSVLWVYDAIYELAHSHPTPAITALVAILLMLVLAVMEGLEVVMPDDPRARPGHCPRAQDPPELWPHVPDHGEDAPDVQ